MGNRTIRRDPGRAHFSLLVANRGGLIFIALPSPEAADAAVDRRLEQRIEHEAGTRDAPQNHPRMDVASEGQATDRRAGQALCQEGDGANPVPWRSVPEDNGVAVAPGR